MCKGYYQLFKQIAELFHASSLLLITSEQPEDVITNRSKFTLCLKLAGLGESAKEIFKDRELSDEHLWDTLIEKYGGHPLWLEMTATMIHELFGGKITEFLSYPSLILSNEIVSKLNKVWVRLTESEKQIVNYLAQQEITITLMDVLPAMSGKYSTEIILNAIRSLKRRGFLEESQNGDRSSLLRLDRTLEAYTRSTTTINNQIY